MQFFIVSVLVISFSGIWFCIGCLYMLYKTEGLVNTIHKGSLEALNESRKAIEAGQKFVDHQSNIIKKLTAFNLELLKENDILKAKKRPKSRKKPL